MKLKRLAAEFIRECYSELGWEGKIAARIKEIDQEIEETNFYEHKYEELVHGAKMAWRNSNRCIGRLFWENLHVIDARKSSGGEDVYRGILHHIKYATNGGKIRPAITIFKPFRNEQDNIMIYNPQLISYAGYKTDCGLIGDAQSVSFTAFCEKSGWEGEKKDYQVLPVVFSIDGNKPEWFSIPSELVKEVSIEHPEWPIKKLNLKWYAVPFISNMRLEIGGISYSAAPFNGWYTGAEIGARNFADKDRFNMLPAVAELMGLETGHNSSLWKDRALVELNAAVLYSFKKQGVTIVDHHTAAEQFRIFEKKEALCRREVTGTWQALIPPMAPACTHMYHKTYNNEIKTPNYFPRECSHYCSEGKNS